MTTDHERDAEIKAMTDLICICGLRCTCGARQRLAAIRESVQRAPALVSTACTERQVSKPRKRVAR